MCEFCLKHGEGRKWCLEAKNYSEDLASDVKRQQIIKDMYEHPEAAAKFVESAERLQKLPRFVRDWLVYYFTNKKKVMHYGQVLPMRM